jgi:hypothetical protein
VDFEQRLQAMDLSLFDTIETQSMEGDRLAWLAIQRYVRRAGDYAYLEIGSFRGGSLQQHVADPKCRRAYSIDPRPERSPDNRGRAMQYEGNTTEQMVKNLSRVPNAQLQRLTCFDTDASALEPSRIAVPPNLCFIDGEHTTEAVLSDFRFCQSVARPDSVIVLHDDDIVTPAIRQLLRLLRLQRRPCKVRKFFGGSTFAFFFGVSKVRDPLIRRLSFDGILWTRMRPVVALGKQIVPSALLPAATNLYTRAMKAPTVTRTDS